MGRGDVRRGDAGQVGHRRQRGQVADLAAEAAHRLDGGPVAGVLERDRTGRQHGEQVPEAVGRAAGDHHLVRVDTGAAGPAEPVGERGAQLGQSARVVVPPRWPGGRHLAPGPAPAGRVPRVDPRRAGVEADQLARRVGAAPRGGRRRRGATRRDEGARPVPGLEPALGDQLLVGLLGHRPADAQVGGERPAARAAGRRGPGCRRRPGRGSRRRAGRRAARVRSGRARRGGWSCEVSCRSGVGLARACRPLLAAD